MPRTPKNPNELLVLVAGKVPRPVKTKLLKILRRRSLTESAYVREAVTEKVKRDLKAGSS